MAKPACFALDPTKAASHFHSLPMVVRDILRLCDGRRSVEAICASSPLAGGETVEVLRQLSRLGVVSMRARPRARRPEPTPRLSAWLDGGKPRAEPARPAAFVTPPAIVSVPVPAPAAVAVTAPRPAPVTATVSAPAAVAVTAPRPAPVTATVSAPAAVAVTAPLPAPIFLAEPVADDFSADEERFFASSYEHLIED